MGRPALHAVVVGSGLAGLSCALELAQAGWRVRVVTAGKAGRDGSTHRVHALAPWILLTAPRVRGDSPDAFFTDLCRRGEGANREDATGAFADGAHAASREIVELLGLEAIDGSAVMLPGDSHPRGLRCLPGHGGPILAPFVRACRLAGVDFAETTLAVGLAVGAAGEVKGLLVQRGKTAVLAEIPCHAAVLACGGPGGVFPAATSPRWCRGSGLAIGAAAGVLLHQPHMTQAVPVTVVPPLYFPGSAPLLNGVIEVDGRRIATEGDVEGLARLVAREAAAGRQVVLREGAGESARLPTRVRSAPEVRREGTVRLTVAVHHGIGGVAIDGWGRTSIPGLYACGEAAGGVQGRRRMMGTGLIEARIFGVRAARAIAHDAERLQATSPAVRRITCFPSARADELEARLDTLMARLIADRVTADLTDAAAQLAGWANADEAGRRSCLAGIRKAAAQVIIDSELRAVAGGKTGGTLDGFRRRG